MKKVKRAFKKCIQILAENPAWSITSLFALFVVLSFGIAANMATITGTSAQSKKLPIYCVETDKKQIALTFDAAWGNEDTQKLLEIFKKHDIKVTFFMTGGWVSDFPDDVKAIHEAGHQLGNHSENHKQMSQISATECSDEIMSVHEKVKELTGYEMEVFRPPYGDYNNTVVDVVNQCGYYCVQWDVDSLDWKDYGAESIISTVCGHKHLGNGSIILCHNGAKYTAAALDTMITNLKSEGYEFVTLSELLHKGEYGRDYKMNHEGRQIVIESEQN